MAQANLDEPVETFRFPGGCSIQDGDTSPAHSFISYTQLCHQLYVLGHFYDIVGGRFFEGLTHRHVVLYREHEVSVRIYPRISQRHGISLAMTVRVNVNHGFVLEIVDCNPINHLIAFHALDEQSGIVQYHLCATAYGFIHREREYGQYVGDQGVAVIERVEFFFGE